MLKHKLLKIELEKYKKKNGTSYVWIGKQIGFSETAFRNVMSGNTKIGLRRAITIARFLGVNLYSIWAEKK